MIIRPSNPATRGEGRGLRAVSSATVRIAVRAVLAGLLAAPLVAQATLDIPAIARRAKGAVVLIEGQSVDGKTVYDGTGFVVRADGVVVTNYHVIAHDATAVAKLPNGAYYPIAGVLASDPKRDIAVIKLKGVGLRTLDLGNSAAVQVGESVVAIGNPESLESSVSSGIVSGLRDDATLGGQFLQITAPISHGSSGGPLFDMHAQVIGVTSMYVDGGENLNFAIPINALRPLLRGLPGKPGPLPGAEQATVATTPAAQSSSAAGSAHSSDYYSGYVAGYIVAMTAAATLARPAGKSSLYVDGTVGDDDTVGREFIYDLKADIASSPLYTLAASASTAAFVIGVVTITDSSGIDTEGAVAIECGAKATCTTGDLVEELAFSAGRDVVAEQAQGMMASIDHSISALPIVGQ